MNLASAVTRPEIVERMTAGILIDNPLFDNILPVLVIKEFT